MTEIEITEMQGVVNMAPVAIRRGPGRPRGGRLGEEDKREVEERRKAKAREAARKWRECNLERAKASCAAWKKEHWDQVKEYQRGYLKQYNAKKREAIHA